MDLFDRCRQFYTNAEYARTLGYPTNPRTAQALGVYPYFFPVSVSEGTEVTVDGKRCIMLGSNNYLGLTAHPRVREAAAAAITTYGTGCTGSRFFNGTLDIHIELEEKLAAFVGKEAALVFAAGYQTNVGTIAALLGKGEVVIADKEAHASIFDGMHLAKGIHGTETRFFRHSDMASLEEILASCPLETPKLIAVDGVFSMGGDIAPLPEIIRLSQRYNARLLVDDAHGLGVLGEGHGTAVHLDCLHQVDLIMGTFSKSFASNGGFIAGPKDVIHWIQHFARSFMFSASLPPANAATVLAGLEVIAREPERVRRVNDIAARMRAELRALELDVGNSETPIVPIVLGDQYRAMQAWHVLLKAGIYTNVALPPAVRARRSLLRTSYIATHTEEQLERVLEGFKKARSKLTHVTPRVVSL